VPISPTLDSVLRALANMARSTALTLITHRPEQILALEVRLRRDVNLIRVLDRHLAALNLADLEVAQCRQLLTQVAELLPVVRPTLAETVDHGFAGSGFALLMVSVAAYKWFNIPHGYWIAFTIMAVLQPDYGATRRKAGQRFAGTLAGGALGSLLLWVKMPVALLIFFASVMAFCFAYFFRCRYGLAVFFVTISTNHRRRFAKEPKIPGNDRRPFHPG